MANLRSITREFETLSAGGGTARNTASLDIPLVEMPFSTFNHIWLYKIDFLGRSPTNRQLDKNAATFTISDKETGGEIFKWTVASTTAPNGSVNVSTPLHANVTTSGAATSVATGAATSGYLITGALNLAIAEATNNQPEGVKVRLTFGTCPPPDPR